MKIDIRHIAKLANLQIEESEQEKFSTQLSSVLDYIGKLNELDTTTVEPTSQVTGLENVLREDETETSLTQEEALSQAKNTHNGLFIVKGLLENE